MLYHTTYGLVVSSACVHFSVLTWFHRPQGWAGENNNVSTMLGWENRNTNCRAGFSMLAEALKTGEDQSAEESSATHNLSFTKSPPSSRNSLFVSIFFLSLLACFYRIILHQGPPSCDLNVFNSLSWLTVSKTL